MTKLLLTTAFATLALVQTTFAASELVGTWKQTHSTCSSGAPYTTYIGSAKTSVSSQIAFAQTALSARVDISMDVDLSQFHSALAQVEDYIKLAERQPDSEGKKTALEQLKKNKADILAIIEQYKNGYACYFELAGFYSTASLNLSITAKMTKSTCGTSQSSQATSISLYSLNNGVLAITAPQAEGGTGCPKGDFFTNYYEKVN